MSGTSRTGSQTVVQVSQGWFGFFPFTDHLNGLVLVLGLVCAHVEQAMIRHHGPCILPGSVVFVLVGNVGGYTKILCKKNIPG